jgi:hypothetical protein
LAAAAVALAQILDNPKAVSTQPAAAKVLATLLEQLRSASARGRRGNLAVVRAMSSSGSGTSIMGSQNLYAARLAGHLLLSRHKPRN